VTANFVYNEENLLKTYETPVKLNFIS